MWETYRARSAADEHAHCEFCWAKFLDPSFSDEHRAFIAEQPEVLTQGYATTGHWVCESCMSDFTEEFGWSAVSRRLSTDDC